MLKILESAWILLFFMNIYVYIKNRTIQRALNEKYKFNFEHSRLQWMFGKILKSL